MNKYHNKLTKEGVFTTRLLITETNISDTFTKVGYLSLKNILASNEIHYTKFNIMKASQVKYKWGYLDHN